MGPPTLPILLTPIFLLMMLEVCAAAYALIIENSKNVVVASLVPTR